MQIPVHASIKDTCARHNCSRSHLYRILGEGKIKAKKNGPHILVDVASADAHFASLPDAKIKPAKRPKATEPASTQAEVA
jgi:hypothetical protein